MTLTDPKRRNSGHILVESILSVTKQFHSKQRFNKERFGRKELISNEWIMLPALLEIDQQNNTIVYEKLDGKTLEFDTLNSQIASFSKLFMFIEDNIKNNIGQKKRIPNSWIKEIYNEGHHALAGNHQSLADLKKIISVLKSNNEGAGLMHGDLSGSNILYDNETNQVYLIDFEYTYKNGDPIWDLAQYTWHFIKLSENNLFYLVFLAYISENIVSNLPPDQSKRFVSYLCRKLIYVNAFRTGEVKHDITSLINYTSIDMISYQIGAENLKIGILALRKMSKKHFINPKFFNPHVRKYYIDDSEISKIIYATNISIYYNLKYFKESNIFPYLKKKLRINYSEYGIQYKQHVLEYIMKLKMQIFFERRDIVTISQIFDNNDLALYQQTLTDFLLPSTTYFTRDEYISSLKHIVKNKLKVLFIGCSTGAEVYTFLLRFANLDLSLIGIDKNISAIKVASKGIFQKEMIKQEIQKDKKVQYLFDDFIIKAKYRKKANFTYGDIFSLSKNFKFDNNKFDLVICRNIVKYFNLTDQRNALSEIHKIMAKGAYIVTGRSKDEKDDDIDPSDILPTKFKKENNFLYRVKW